MSATLVDHPRIGPRIVLAGGSKFSIHSSIATALDIATTPVLPDMRDLALWSLDPRTRVVRELQLSDAIAGVAYHGVVLRGQNLWLAGGLNYSSEWRCSYAHTLIRLDIFAMLSASEFPSMPREIESTNGENGVDWTEIDDLYWEIQAVPALVEIHEAHLAAQFPPNEFTFVHGVPCSRIVLQATVGDAILSDLPWEHASDFVRFLYTGTILPGPLQLETLLRFLRFCRRLRLDRLLWLAIVTRVCVMSTIDIMRVAAMPDRNNVPLMDEAPIARYILYRALGVNGFLLTGGEFDLVPDVHLISDVLMTVLAGEVPQLEVPRIPGLSAQVRLLTHFTKCADGIVLIDPVSCPFDITVLADCPAAIADAVLQVDPRPLFHQTTGTPESMSAYRTVQTMSSPRRL
jgi:hypothetical protein